MEEKKEKKDCFKLFFSDEQLKKLPIYVVFPLIGITYVVFMTLLLFLFPVVYGNESHNVFWIIIANIMYYLITYNFYRCHYTSSDCIPKEYYQINEEKKDEYEYCDECKIYKADRVHHCSASNKCIYRFDHFCAFIGNSLGLHNYRYFFLFLFYLWASVLLIDFHVYKLFTTADLVCFIIFFIKQPTNTQSQLPYAVLVFISLFFGNLTFAVTMEMLFIALTITFNYTSKEVIETFSLYFKEKKWTKNRYYKSILANWKEVMQVPSNKPLILGFLPTAPRFDLKHRQD